MKKVVVDLPIYTFHIDFNGHVSNIVAIQWMEILRLKFLEAVGSPVEKMMKAGIAPVLTETHISYKKPLFLGDEVRGECWLSELNSVTVWLEFRFYNSADELVASGRQRGVFMNITTKRPYRPTPEQQAIWREYLETS